MFSRRFNTELVSVVLSVAVLGGTRLPGTLPADPATPAEKAMAHVCRRMDACEKLFLYRDFGSGDNADFVPSGWMGDIARLSIDEDCHRQPHDTCIRIEYAGSGWAGLYWQRPAGNWGTVPNGGRDLRPATMMTFQARTDGPEMSVEIGIGGIAGRHGDSASKRSRRFTLTDRWQRFELDLTGMDLSHIVGGFLMVVSGPGAVYLDDIAYGTSRSGSRPRLIPSYVVSSQSPLYPVNQNAAFLYDNALAIMAYACRAKSEDVVQAERRQSTERLKLLADAILVALEHDRSYADGRLRNAYWSGGDFVDYQGFARLPGWYDAATGQWCEDSYAVSSYTGPLAWAALGLLEAWEVVEQKRPDSPYLQAAERVMSWIERETHQEDHMGGFSAGYQGREPQPQKLQWRSTEHNIDVLAAARRLAQATGNAKWERMADHAKRFLDRMYSPDGYFWTGTLPDGKINHDIIALDCQTWAILTLADDAQGERLLKWAEANLKATERRQGFEVAGYSYSTAETGVWTEGSAQMGLAYLQAGNETRAQEVRASLRTIQQGFPGTDGQGLVAACRNKLATGFGEYYYPELSVAATGWFTLLEMRYNPLLGKTIGRASGEP